MKKKQHCFLMRALRIVALCLFLFFAWMGKELWADDVAVASIPIEDEIAASGSLTDTASWKITLDEEGVGTLVIEGTGTMVDYESKEEQPWANYINVIRHLVVEDGITRIGSCSMHNLYFTDVSIGKDVESIGYKAFAYGKTLTTITIPGNVKVVEKEAFHYHGSLVSVELEEGVEKLEDYAFCSLATGGGVVSIPASVTSIGQRAYSPGSAYEVSEENPVYSSYEGVLYNKDRTELVDYPDYRSATEFRIPETVRKISDGAFSSIVRTKKVYIPATVQEFPNGNLFSWSDVEEVYVEDGTPIPGEYTFYSCKSLTKARLPENTEIPTLNRVISYGCKSLESFKIPDGVKKIYLIGSPLPSLTELTYDARNAQIQNSAVLDSSIAYELTIGANVDYLPKEFKWISSQASDLRFEASNQFEVEEGAFSETENPIAGFSGTYYVDHQGVVYHYDGADGTAEVVLCQVGVSASGGDAEDNGADVGGDAENDGAEGDIDELSRADVVIPAYITPEEGLTCKVVAVGKQAFSKADGIESVVFEAPDQVVKISSYGFANCTTLERVNGATTVSGAKESFPSAVSTDGIGYRAFYNTALEKAEGSDDAGSSGGDSQSSEGRKELTVKEDGIPELRITAQSDGETMEWKSAGSEETGHYTLLTGDTLTFLCYAGNTEREEDFVYRVYFEKGNSNCKLSITPGETYSFNGQEAICYATEDENTVYLEFTPLIGKTLSIPVTAVYPSPKTSGGKVTVWGFALTKDEAEEYGTKYIAPTSGTIQAFWSTKREDFTITKTSTGRGNIVLAGEQDGTVRPDCNLDWKIVLQRQNETVSAYGKDYVKSVTYKDWLELPEGMTWDKNVLDAIQNSKVHCRGTILYVGDVPILSLSLNSGKINLASVKLKWDENLERPVLQFKVTNTDTSAEMGTNIINVCIYKASFEADAELFIQTENPSIVNHVEAAVKYHYSSKVSMESEASKSVTAKGATLNLTKQTAKAYYFGEALQYTVTFQNSGAFPYEGTEAGSWILEDTLSPYSYLTAEDMERMLKEDSGENLLIAITNVQRMTWEERQSIFGGGTSWNNIYNSGVNEQSEGTQTVEIRWNETYTAFSVTVEEDSYEGNSISELLQQAGYAPTRWTNYKTTWLLNEEDAIFCVSPGQVESFAVYAHAKDTFMMLTEDWQNQYPLDSGLKITNTVRIRDHNLKVIKSNSANNTLYREASIGKNAFLYGEKLVENFTADDGTVLEYQLEFSHYGSSPCENLPMVDDMYGAQALLVPVAKNPALMDMDLSVISWEGEEYFILTEGQYENVIVGISDDGKDCLAETILVEKAEQDTSVTVGENYYIYRGLHTKVKWHFSKINSGNQKIQLTYLAIIDQSLAGTNVFYLGNIVWMNDKVDSRIYDSLWGGGSIVDFDKQIVEQKGESYKEDVLDEDGYSVIQEGEKVTYRLMLANKGQGELTICGDDIADRLPQNGLSFSWKARENVTISYESTHQSTTIQGLDEWEISPTWSGLEEEGQQYILWPASTQIHFSEENAKVYIYVTLDFPENLEMERTWELYCDAMNGETLVNTFYVYHFPSNVIHQLGEEGKVLLQKGVYGMSYGNVNQYIETASRLYYNNKDSANRQITYYVVLYNGGNKKLYINDIYDKLPDGFTFTNLLKTADINQTGNAEVIVTAASFAEDGFLTYGDKEVVYKNARIKRVANEQGSLQFRVSQGTGDALLSYDDTMGKYYLNKNEAIVFGYICDIGSSDMTTNTAVNTVSMPYEDYLGTGVTSIENNEIHFFGTINEVHKDQNDGACSLETAATVKTKYGFMEENTEGKDEEDTTEETEQEGREEETNSLNHERQWLVSEVAVHRGGIVPGITKYVESYLTPGNNEPQEYTSSVSPFDTIEWRVRLHNTGTLSINDYTVTDSLPAPYEFTGEISYGIYDYEDNLIRKITIWNFVERSGNNITGTVDGVTKKITIGGERLSVYTKFGYIEIWMEREETGNERLYLHFSQAVAAIPEGGYGDLWLSSCNTSASYENTVYTNQAIFTPNVQAFEKASQGSLIKDSENQAVAVKNSASVTVSYGYGTSSQKSVMEKENTDNQAVSANLDKNYILLPSQESVFTYQLTVSNDTNKSMEKLILIDSLPEPEDTSPFDETAPRNSAFTVSLAEDLNFKVLVATEDGQIYELDENYYEIGYEEKTVFLESDWNGTFDWMTEQTRARAVRIVIQDETGEMIPAKAQVSISFDAVVEGEAEPGTIAWNSFGYHYKLWGVEQELEAMPLVVGVQVPSVPQLQKKVIDYYGTEKTVPEEVVFTFLIHQGESLKDSLDGASYKDSLDSLDIEYREVEVKVEKGMSHSDFIRLTLEDWEWKEGEIYTVMETSENVNYEFHSFNSLSSEYFTFTYHSGEDLEIICQNLDVNSKGYQFPEAGGKGVFCLIFVGILLLILAILYFYSLKREKDVSYEKLYDKR